MERRDTASSSSASSSTLSMEVRDPAPCICAIFSDLPDSTELWEVSENLMAPSHALYYSTMRSLLPRFSGYEVKNLGDGFFITFPSATLALRFCLSVQKALAEIKWPDEIIAFRARKDRERGLQVVPGRGIVTRLGIHFGAPFESKIDPVSGRLDYHGNMVNIAARVMTQAAADEIAVSDAVIMELQATSGDTAGIEIADDLVMLDRVRVLEIALKNEGEDGFKVVRMGMRKLKGVAIPKFITLLRLKSELLPTDLQDSVIVTRKPLLSSECISSSTANRSLATATGPPRISPVLSTAKDALQKTETPADSRVPRKLPLPKARFEKLLTFWEAHMLPFMHNFIPESIAKPMAVHLMAMGTYDDDTVPVIQVVAKRVPSIDQQAETREILLSAFPEDLEEGILVQFQASTLRRTGKKDYGDQNLPPLCAARNTRFFDKPPMGSSIGIEGSTDHTATLGGYIMLDESVYVLTVHHLLPDLPELLKERKLPGPCLTQSSAQEFEQWRHISGGLNQLYERMKGCCKQCRNQRVKLSADQGFLYCSGLFQDELSQLEKLMTDTDQCQLLRDAIKMKHKQHRDRPYHFATFETSSGFKHRPTSGNDCYMVEMDWALFKPTRERIGSNELPEGQVCRECSPIIPGAEVYSSGRTSGYQKGIINSSRTYVDHGDHETREWAVMKPPELEVAEWIEGGLGVEGDSGAWIIDCTTNKLYGMLWGRHGEGPDTVTYFTPIAEIVADIKRSIGGEADFRLP